MACSQVGVYRVPGIIFQPGCGMPGSLSHAMDTNRSRADGLSTVVQYSE